MATIVINAKQYDLISEKNHQANIGDIHIVMIQKNEYG